MEPRASTIAARFGFQDSELKTARHDEIMLWLDENIDALVGSWSRPWDEKKIGDAERLYAAAREMYPELPAIDPIPEAPRSTVLSKKWEVPLMNGQYVVGFVDMVVVTRVASGFGMLGMEWKVDKWVRDWGTPLKEPKWEVGYKNERWYFEVKPQIPSLGELIRQINMYRQYDSGGGKFAVVCPDDRFRAQLISQGIGFIKCP